jgi:hypothetical protein
MQITDVFSVPKVGLMALWFGGDYSDKPTQSWGTMTSSDDGKTWTQTPIESGLLKADWPTEPAAVYLGDGKILAIARTETGPSQFQMISTDNGASTPSLILDSKTGPLSNYYFERGRGLLRRRVVDPSHVFDRPLSWPGSEAVATGSKVTFDAGNANATVIGDTHYISIYSGKTPDTAVVVSEIAAPAAR